jgi:hypothetical protein
MRILFDSFDDFRTELQRECRGNSENRPVMPEPYLRVARLYKATAMAGVRTLVVIAGAVVLSPAGTPPVPRLLEFRQTCGLVLAEPGAPPEASQAYDRSQTLLMQLELLAATCHLELRPGRYRLPGAPPGAADAERGPSAQ